MLSHGVLLIPTNFLIELFKDKFDNKYSLIHVSSLLTILFSNIYLNLSNAQYYKYDPEQCRPPDEYKISKESEVPNMPEETLDQKNFGMCYGFAAAKLLQYHYENDLIKKNMFKKGKHNQLSIVDILSKSQDKDKCFFKEFGRVDSVLHRIKERGRNILLRSNMSEEFQDYSKCMESYFNSDEILVLESEVEKLIQTQEKIISKLRASNASIEPKILPDYNVVHINELNQPRTSVDFIESHFNKIPPLPIALSIFLSSFGETYGGHALNLKGFRKVCCGGRCHNEVKVENSYGRNEATQGWMVLDKFKIKGLTYLEPCSDDGDKKCFDQTKAFKELSEIIKIGDSSKLLDYLKQNPSVNINKQDEDGNSLLLIAINSGNPLVVKILLDQGGDVELKNKEGYNSIFLALKNDNIYLLGNVLAYGGNLHSRETKMGNTPLLEAVNNRGFKNVEFLINQFPRLNLEVTNNNGNTPFLLAVSQGQIEIANLLFKRGSKIDVKNSEGLSALDLAKAKDDQNMIEFLNGIMGLNEDIEHENSMIIEGVQDAD
jgi:hypothetical protein